LVLSMTGYGRGVSAGGGVSAAVEIRTLNHRYLDVRVRLPGPLLALEDSIRQAVQRRLQRGRVEITVSVEDSDDQSRTVIVDLGLLAQARAALEQARGALGADEPLRLEHLALVPGVFRMEERETDLERYRAVIEAALDEALSGVLAMRRAEGRALAADVAARMDAVERLVRSVESRVPEAVREAHQRLRRRVAELAGDVALDEGRLEMEVAILADRSDVSEETARIASHIAQFRTLLQAGGAVGRKLDFLLQELHREWNTIGSKANDAVIAQAVVDAKAELEKVREQVQNIE